LLNVKGDAHHAFGGAKNSDYGNLIVYDFTNPWGSGGKHVYLIGYELAPQVSNLFVSYDVEIDIAECSYGEFIEPNEFNFDVE